MSGSSTTRRLLARWPRRLLRARRWIALQLVCVALLVLAGLGWTRIPEKHAWQVILSLLIPLVISAGFLLLQSGTMRSLLEPLAQAQNEDSPWVSMAWGATTLLLWIAVAWVAWDILDRFDDKIDLWSGYLNSRFGAGLRARIATEEHIASTLNLIERVLRWVIVPGLLVPLATSAASGLRRLPWGRVARVWLNWRWWPGVLAAPLIGVAWPHSFFTALPHGSVSAQVWRVVLKLIATYLLAVASWVALLAWSASLLCSADSKTAGPDEPEDFSGVGVRNLPPDGGKSTSVRLPLPDESGQDPSGHA